MLAQVWTADWMTELWKHTPILIIRTLLTFGTMLLVVRWTGKRSIANLAPFDLAMVIMIGEVASIPVADLEVDLLHGILPVALIGALHVFTTWLSLQSRLFEKWAEGRPTVLVKDGQVLRKNLLKERVSMADLLAALRHKEIRDLSDVKEAWIEHAGGISVIRTPEADAVTQRDLAAMLEQSIERIVERHSARIRQELEELLREYRGRPGG